MFLLQRQPVLFFNYSVKMNRLWHFSTLFDTLTHFDFWQFYRNLAYMIIYLFTTPEKCRRTTLWDTDLFHLIDVLFSSKWTALKLAGDNIEFQVSNITCSVLTPSSTISLLVYIASSTTLRWYLETLALFDWNWVCRTATRLSEQIQLKVPTAHVKRSDACNCYVCRVSEGTWWLLFRKCFGHTLIFSYDFLKYTVSQKKTRHQTHAHNFPKC